MICKFFTKPKHQFYIISYTYVTIQYFPHYSTVYLSTHNCTVKILLFFFLATPLLSPESYEAPGWPPGAHSRGLAHEVTEPGQTWLVSKPGKISQAKPAPSQSSSCLPGFTSSFPSRKLTAKISLLKRKAHPSLPEAKPSYHSGLLFAYRFTD